MLLAAHRAGRLQFFGDQAALANKTAFARYLKSLRNSKWVVYCKRPFAGPKQVLRYLSRYTHRVYISNRRLGGRREQRHLQVQRLPPRRVGPLQDHDAADRRVHPALPHPRATRFIASVTTGCLPKPITRPTSRARVLGAPSPAKEPDSQPPEADATDQPRALPRPCPGCGSRMIIIETFARGCAPAPPTPTSQEIRIDTS